MQHYAPVPIDCIAPIGTWRQTMAVTRRGQRCCAILIKRRQHAFWGRPVGDPLQEQAALPHFHTPLVGRYHVCPARCRGSAEGCARGLPAPAHSPAVPLSLRAPPGTEAGTFPVPAEPAERPARSRGGGGFGRPLDTRGGPALPHPR